MEIVASIVKASWFDHSDRKNIFNVETSLSGLGRESGKAKTAIKNIKNSLSLKKSAILLY